MSDYECQNIWQILLFVKFFFEIMKELIFVDTKTFSLNFQ
jgi:hypothetical protein